MKKSMILAVVLAFVACVACTPAHGYTVLIKNATGKPVRVNLGAVARKGSYHIGMNAGQSKFIETGGFIPEWISAYTYDDSWQNMGNERTVQENKNIQDVHGCSGNRHITIYGDPDRKITCDRGGLRSADYEDYTHTDWLDYNNLRYERSSGNDW